jgi:hypothetical protein
MSKGDALEIKAKKILEDWGFCVHRVSRSRTYRAGNAWRSTGNNDLFGCFDIFAVSPDHLSHLIQVTTENHVWERKKKVDDLFPLQPNNIFIEVWGWHGGRGKQFFRVYRRSNMVWKRCEDVPG